MELNNYLKEALGVDNFIVKTRFNSKMFKNFYIEVEEKEEEIYEIRVEMRELILFSEITPFNIKIGFGSYGRNKYNPTIFLLMGYIMKQDQIKGPFYEILKTISK